MIFTFFLHLRPFGGQIFCSAELNFFRLGNVFAQLTKNCSVLIFLFKSQHFDLTELDKVNTQKAEIHSMLLPSAEHCVLNTTQSMPSMQQIHYVKLC